MGLSIWELLIYSIVGYFIYRYIKKSANVDAKINTSPQDYKAIVDKLKNKKTGEITITLEQLAKALHIKADNYISNFTPDNNLLGNITFGSMAGGAAGTAFTAASFVQGAVSSYKAGGLYVGSLYSGFHINDEDVDLLNGLALLLANGLITKNEFIKGAASIAYNSGQGLCNIAEIDAFGDMSFKSDDDRRIAAICYQFFAENTVAKARIEALYSDKKSSLPDNVES